MDIMNKQFQRFPHAIVVECTFALTLLYVSKISSEPYAVHVLLSTTKFEGKNSAI